jgi:2,4-dienoyl-CoA reductase-like NADH-dependent reductase (Old Yellow Enzyme family)
MPLTHLLKPISINKLEVKNRILRTAHGTYYGRGSITDDLIAYHEARARGQSNYAWIMRTMGFTVTPDSESATALLISSKV